MFFLKDLPDDKTLEEFAARYPELNPSALKACAVLLRTGSDMLVTFERFLGNYGLSQGRFLTLIVMNRTPETPANPSVLADQVGVTRATMTGLLDGLEREGLIKRVAYHGDRRKVGALLTDAGRSALDKVLPSYYTLVNELMTGLNNNENKQLVDLLIKVSHGLEKARDNVI